MVIWGNLFFQSESYGLFWGLKLRKDMLQKERVLNEFKIVFQEGNVVKIYIFFLLEVGVFVSKVLGN